jgi:hypothetical protein
VKQRHDIITRTGRGDEKIVFCHRDRQHNGHNTLGTYTFAASSESIRFFFLRPTSVWRNNDRYGSQYNAQS